MNEQRFFMGGAAALSLCAGLSLSLVLGGCGSEEPTAMTDAKPMAEGATGEEVVKEGRPSRTRPKRLGKKRGADARRDEDRRKRNEASLKEWSEQNLYMHLAIEELKLTEEQRLALAEMNWKHFFALQEKEAERPRFNDALVKMLTEGKIDAAAFEADRKWIAENAAIEAKYFIERMTALHETLTPEQRAELAKLVEQRQNADNAKEDERLAAVAEMPTPEGCAGGGNRSISRLITGAAPSREQRTKMWKLLGELSKDYPSPEKMKDLLQARRMFDALVRKAFAAESFDIAKLMETRPRIPHTEPVAVSECSQRELEGLLKIFTEEQRQKLAKISMERRAKRRSEAPDASVGEGAAE